MLTQIAKVPWEMYLHNFVSCSFGENEM